mmetsp:Transcript_27532/g.65588  ORF Transcript_27532/g.65588 Transcript_27532/m.65588 type:complete len:236 (-) Transcript_27532:959-1666(-)
MHAPTRALKSPVAFATAHAASSLSNDFSPNECFAGAAAVMGVSRNATPEVAKYSSSTPSSAAFSARWGARASASSSSDIAAVTLASSVVRTIGISGLVKWNFSAIVSAVTPARLSWLRRYVSSARRPVLGPLGHMSVAALSFSSTFVEAASSSSTVAPAARSAAMARSSAARVPGATSPTHAAGTHTLTPTSAVASVSTSNISSPVITASSSAMSATHKPIGPMVSGRPRGTQPS